MKKNKQITGSKEARRLALKKVLQVLGLFERTAAELFGIPYSKLNNITRNKSRSVLDLELALQIQAATGISADSLMRGENPPVMLNGEKISREFFNAWKERPVSDENKRNQVNEIGFMSALLLEAAGAKGDHFRRRTYHLLRALLEEMRKSSGISMAEINETARLGAKLTSYQATRKDLDQEIGQSPIYLAIRDSIPARGSIQVVHEAFQTWCDPAPFAHLLPEVPDKLEVTRNIYRLQIGDQWHPVIADKFSGQGIGSSGRARKQKESIGKFIPYQAGEEN